MVDMGLIMLAISWIGVVLAAIFERRRINTVVLPVIVIYTAVVYWMFRGKLRHGYARVGAG